MEDKETEEYIVVLDEVDMDVVKKGKTEVTRYKFGYCQQGNIYYPSGTKLYTLHGKCAKKCVGPSNGICMWTTC